MAFWKPRISFS